MIAERTIRFEPWEIRALVAGEKSVFRRPNAEAYRNEYGRSPYGEPGDLLRVEVPWDGTSILLEVVSVRVERLHAITDDDAVREGAHRYYLPRPRQGFIDLWNSADVFELDQTEYWWANPWVWRVEFRRVS